METELLFGQATFLLWVPSFLSYELWKLRIELWKLLVQTGSKTLLHFVIIFFKIFFMPSHYSIKERKCIKKNLTFVTTDLDFKINI